VEETNPVEGIISEMSEGEGTIKGAKVQLIVTAQGLVLIG